MVDRSSLPQCLGSVAMLLVALASGCCSTECDPDRLPFRGHAETPDDLAKIVQHEAKHECYSELYRLLSARTRSQYSRLEWRIGIGSVKIPDYDYKVVDVVEKGTYVAALPDPANPNEAIAIYDYQEPGKKPLSAHVLLIREEEELRSGVMAPLVWHIALEDQKSRIEEGDGRYWWFEKPRPVVQQPANGPK